MEEKKVLTTEELQSIKDLQLRYDQLVFDLGSVEAQLYSLTNAKTIVFDDMKKVIEAEKTTMNALQEKYGIGNIDMKTGEITPFPEQA